MKKDVRKTIAICVIVCFTMFSFCFSLVPIYNVICKTTGLNGRVNLTPASAINGAPPNLKRPLTMQFVTTANANLNWDFYPAKTTETIHPDENSHILFYVKNKTKKTMTVQAIPSITPWQAASHLHKIECFCFRQQTLKPGESLAMPVVFRVDNTLPSTIKTITLAYTLFDVTKATPPKKD